MLRVGRQPDGLWQQDVRGLGQRLRFPLAASWENLACIWENIRLAVSAFEYNVACVSAIYSMNTIDHNERMRRVCTCPSPSP
jgi:hypothetical protein